MAQLVEHLLISAQILISGSWVQAPLCSPWWVWSLLNDEWMNEWVNQSSNHPPSKGPQCREDGWWSQKTDGGGWERTDGRDQQRSMPNMKEVTSKLGNSMLNSPHGGLWEAFLHLLVICGTCFCQLGGFLSLASAKWVALSSCASLACSLLFWAREF